MLHRAHPKLVPLLPTSEFGLQTYFLPAQVSEYARRLSLNPQGYFFGSSRYKVLKATH
ncbi:hypothetical protein DSUL_20052 [Desulfovibrionales bacterium]